MQAIALVGDATVAMPSCHRTVYRVTAKTVGESQHLPVQRPIDWSSTILN